MRNAPDTILKWEIYRNGGAPADTPLTLEQLSENAAAWFGNSPYYNIYRSGFARLGREVENDEPGNFDSRSVDVYANTTVDDLFKLEVDFIEAEAALVMNVAMAFWGSLWNVMEACRDDNPSQMTQALDQAAAYWVGADQVKGDQSTGYSFYNAAQFAGDRFNQNQGDSEVDLNKAVLAELNSIQRDIQQNTCVETDGYKTVRRRVKNLHGHLNRLLVQLMLYRIDSVVPDEDSDFVELYILSLLPQIGACNPDAYYELVDTTILNNVGPNERQQVIATLQSIYPCLHITCADVGSYKGNVIPACDDNPTPYSTIERYLPSHDMRSFLAMDRDILQIRAMMEYGAYEAAKDFFDYGWNGVITFGAIAGNRFLAELSMTRDFQAIANYYSDHPAGDGLSDRINSVFQGAAPFSSASLEERVGMIDGFLRGLMFLAATATIEEGLEDCRNGDSDGAAKHWDESVSFFVGSTEGSQEGGARNVAGASLWGLGDTYCEFFGNCEPNDAEVNERLIALYESGKQKMSLGQCDSVDDLYTNNIRPDLLVAMIQGTLYGYLQRSKNTSIEAGYAHGLSRVLVPVLSGELPSGADTSALEKLDLETNYAISSESPTDAQVNQVFGQLTTIYNVLDWECDAIGAIRADTGDLLKVCTGDVSAPPIPAPPTPPGAAPTLAPTNMYNTPTRSPAGSPKVPPPEDGKDIAFNRYQFVDVSWANNDARFSLDVKNLWTATSLEQGVVIYSTGGSVPSGLSGNPSITTLQAMSTTAETVMKDDMMYNFYRYARYEDADFDKSDISVGSDPWPYGNTVVNLALDSNHGRSVKLAAEASISMNIWMMIVHQLYEAERRCEGAPDAAKYIDSAVGLWIGEEQGEAMFDTGYSMYSLGQEAHKLYGNPEEEAPANTKLMTLFGEAQAAARMCGGGDPNARIKLRERNDEVIKGLTLPLVQMLLYYLSVQDANYVELFSLAFIPQLITCNVDRYDELSAGLFQAKALEETEAYKRKLLENLAGGLSCLRYTCEDLGDVSGASESLSIIVQDLCDDIENDFDIGYLASYQISEGGIGVTEVNELARLDLDLLQIEILMKANAITDARHIFENGRNARGLDYENNRSLMSLKGLVEDEAANDAGDIYDAYTNYFGQSFDAGIISVIESVFDKTGTTSRLAMAETVVRSIQTSAVYVNVMGRLRQAVQVCGSGAPDGFGASLVDQATALFVGSIEGSKSGGSESNSGTMLMALGKEVCASFVGGCESQGDATVNEDIMFALSSLQTWLQSGNCNAAENILNDNLSSMLPVSMIQATIKYASDASVPGASEETRAAAHTIGESIIPLVGAVNQTSAARLVNTLSVAPNQNADVNEVVDALSYALRGMGVDCNTVGVLASNGVSTCRDTDEAIPPPVDTPTDLGDGKYTATTNVQDRADIAKDIKQMKSELSVGDVNLATLIYSDGENSPIYDSVGTRVDTRSLKKFSTEAASKMTTNPLYQATLFGLRKENNEYLNAPVEQYADSIVSGFLATGSDVAVDAAIALNLWMETANELFQMVTNCKNQKLKDDDGVHSIDEAAAYWLGDAKTDSQVEHGHLLYALAEEMALNFDTVGANGQAVANTNLLQLLHAAKLELSYPDACSEDQATARRTRHVVNKAISQMMVPLVQGLIHNILVEDKHRVKVYAHAVVPHLVSCSVHVHAYLMEKLIFGSYVASEIDEIVLKLQSVYDCLGITCADIGYHKDPSLEIDCSDVDEIKSLCGYRTRTDAGEYAQLDLDILELDVLMAMEAYEAAEELYSFGRHAHTGADNGRVSLSLQSLATNAGRSNVPVFRKFQDFYGNNVDYADTIMFKTFDSSDMTMSPIQRRYVAVGTAQYMIMYMAALQNMHEADQACVRDAQDITASELWDRAAAYIIGHLEGTAREGSNEGFLIWGLAKALCAEWGTCSATVEGNAVANERIRTLLYTGRGALTGGRKDSCSGLKNAATEIEKILLGPLIQGVLSSMVRTAETTGVVKVREHAKAHALANALLPYVHGVNRDAASTIVNNLDFDGTPLSDGLTNVVNAFTSTMGKFGVDCRDVGISTTVDSCSGQVSEGKSPLVILVIAIVVVATLAICALVYLKLSKRRTKEAAVFVPNEKGELSHDTVIGNGPSDRGDAADMMHNDADAAAEDDFEHLPETV